MTSKIIQLPNNWQPRPYQLAGWNYLRNGGKRLLLVCHRRWGKDDVALHWTAIATQKRPASYWHLLPLQNQARRAIWTAVNPHTGKRRIDEAFPLDLRKRTLDNEMFIEFKNGSTWQVLGSDNYNNHVGAPPAGVVVSEWSLADPKAWAYLSPILIENGGWAAFLYTARGRNHGYTLWRDYKDDPNWHVELQTVKDTQVIPNEALQEDLKEKRAIYGPQMAKALWDQEWFCSWDAAIQGAYYGDLLTEAEQSGRITVVPYETGLPVHTAWDLGYNDTTAIWFFQLDGFQIRIIDHYEASGAGLEHYYGILKEKNYHYGQHIFPHDLQVHDLGSGKSRKQTLEGFGLTDIIVLKQEKRIEDGIQAVRGTLSKVWFDSSKCERGLDALRQYRADYDEKNKTLRQRPLHDWSSNSADAFRYLVRGLDQMVVSPTSHTRYEALPEPNIGMVV